MMLWCPLALWNTRNQNSNTPMLTGHYECIMVLKKMGRILHFLGHQITGIFCTINMAKVNIMVNDGVSDGIFLEVEVAHFFSGMVVGPIHHAMIVAVCVSRMIGISKGKIAKNVAVRKNIFGHGISCLDFSFTGATAIFGFALGLPWDRPAIVDCDKSNNWLNILSGDENAGIKGWDQCILGSPVGIGEGTEVGTNILAGKSIQGSAAISGEVNPMNGSTVEVLEDILGCIEMSRQWFL